MAMLLEVITLLIGNNLQKTGKNKTKNPTEIKAFWELIFTGIHFRRLSGF